MMSCQPRRNTVLVVEDETLIRMMAVDIFEEGGFEVLEAGHAGAALQLLAQHPEVSALFTDVDMPGDLNGFDLALRSRVTHPGIAVQITSGRTIRALGGLPPGTRFLAKPYRPEEAVAGVRELLAVTRYSGREALLGGLTAIG
jgi:CheY-like chemotaxis protein